MNRKKNLIFFFSFGWLLFLSACGTAPTEEQAKDDDEILHVNLSPRASTMLFDSADAQISEIKIQRFSCPDGSEPVDYTLRQVAAEKVFILNEKRTVLVGCSLRLRGMTLTLNRIVVSFDAIKDQMTTAGTSETILANSGRTTFLNSVVPSKIPSGAEKNIFWPLIVSYVDTKTRLFPLEVEAREPGVAGLGMVISRLEDRGTVNGVWREFGVSLSCLAPQLLGSCNSISFAGMTARFALQSDVDLGDAQKIRAQGGLFDQLFTAGLTHYVGSGLRFTLTTPLAFFGQPLYLIVMKGQSYSVFSVAAGSVPSANANE